MPFHVKIVTVMAAFDVTVSDARGSAPLNQDKQSFVALKPKCFLLFTLNWLFETA